MRAHAILGARLSRIERLFRDAGWIEGAGASADVVHLALSHFGLTLELGYVADMREPLNPLWQVLCYCPGDIPLLIAIDDMNESHWITSHAGWIADTHTLGRWVPWDDYGLHADAPVWAVWIVERRRH